MTGRITVVLLHAVLLNCLAQVLLAQISEGQGSSHRIPPSVGLDLFHCEQLRALVSAASDCQPVQVDAAGPDHLGVQQCKVTDRHHTGVFRVLIFSNNVPFVGIDVFKIRVAGPEVIQPPVFYCGHAEGAAASAYVPIALTRPGEYHADVLHLYTNWTSNEMKPANDVLRIAGVDFEVTADEARATAAAVSCRAAGKHCETCRDGVHPGRWVISGGATPKNLGIRENCPYYWTPYDGVPGNYDKFRACPNTYLTAVTLNTSQLWWEPDACELPAAWSGDGKTPCQQQREQPGWRACFTGDSHSRIAFNVFVASLEGVPPTNATLFGNKELFETPYGEYWWNPWGKTETDEAAAAAASSSESSSSWMDPDAVHPSTFENCSDVVMGQGQWSASWVHVENSGHPMALEQYGHELRRMAAFLSELRLRGKRVHFMTMPSYPLSKGEHRDAAIPGVGMEGMTIDYRTDPLLISYNRLAARVMAEAGVPLIDSFSASTVLNDLSFDTMHFIGNVGNAINQAVVAALCPADDGGVAGSRKHQHKSRHSS